MPNVFEKPIAANPISEFEGLPLQYVNQALQQRQSRYDTAMADMETQRSNLLQIQARQVDTGRLREIDQEYDTLFDKAVDEVGGDYSMIRGSLDAIKRRINLDLSVGELGAIQKNRGLASKYSEDLTKRYTDGKISASDYQLGQQSLSGGKTTRLDDGSYSSFRGHTTREYYDVNKALRDAGKIVHARYSADGTSEFKSKSRLTKEIYKQALQDDKLRTALLTDMAAAGVDSKNFSSYLATKIDPIAGSMAYAKNDASKKLALKKAQDEGKEEFVVSGVATAPTVDGEFNYSGGAFGWAGDFVRKITGGDNDAYRTSINTDEGKRVAAKYERVMGKELSNDPRTAMAELENFKNHLAGPEGRTGRVEIFAPTSKKLLDEAEFIRFTNDGAFRNPNMELINSEAENIDPEDLQGLTDKGKPLTTYQGRLKGVTGVHPPGTEVYVKDGEQYFQLPTKSEDLQSSDYLLWQLNSVGNTIGDQGSLVLTGKAANTMGIPNGTYNVVKDNTKFGDGEADVYTLKMGKDFEVKVAKTIDAQGRVKWGKIAN